MKKLILSLSVLFLLSSISLTVFANDEYMNECKELAKEEGVKGEELDIYIQECIESMKADSENQEEKK
ncbi:MAG: hypothetical protein HQL46_13360 [Gammaproteobacteria bacterium]|nr:hypothetical protein [Gammaproteobacteria bacterium]